MQFANSWSALMLVTLLAGGILHSARPMALSAQDLPTAGSMGPVQGATIDATARVTRAEASHEVRALADRMTRALTDRVARTAAGWMTRTLTAGMARTPAPAAGKAQREILVVHERRPWLVGWIDRSAADSQLRIDVADLGH